MADGELHPGQEISLRLPRGAEVFCASGSLRLVATEPWLGAGLTQRLVTGQGWRAVDATQVTLLAQEPAQEPAGSGRGPGRPHFVGWGERDSRTPALFARRTSLGFACGLTPAYKPCARPPTNTAPASSHDPQRRSRL